MKKKRSLYTGILLIVAIIVVVNIISYSYFFRLDFTRDKRYTLSKPTLTLLKNLKQPVTVTAYFTENMPDPTFTQSRNDFKEMLIEYAMQSGNKVVYNFIDPNKSDSTEKEVMKNGIRPTTVNVREKDGLKSKRVFLDAIVKYGDKTDNISLVVAGANGAGRILPSGGPMENLLTQSIKKLTVDRKPDVALLQGNGEPKMEAIRQLYESLKEMYDFHELQLSDSSAIPESVKTIIIIDPKDTFSTVRLRNLDNFLARGGSMFIAYSGLSDDLQYLKGKAVNNGFTPWLAAKNIMVDPKFIIDERCDNINVPSQQSFGGRPLYQQMPFPFAVDIVNLASHPITQGVSALSLPFVSDIKFTGDTNKQKYIPLAYTSDRTGLLPAPVDFDLNHNWTINDFPLANLPVAAAITGVNGNKDAKIVIVSCAGFVINGTGQRPVPQSEDNINLVVNSIDWLSDDTGLIELRSKVVRPVPIKDVSDSMRTFLKYMNFLLPILLVIIYGAVRMQMKRRKRVKRMEETYV
jgi:gliding-associated putative ABC transporter substrate-binding component GldG